MPALALFTTARAIVRTYGARGLARRTAHELRRRAGWFHAAPAAMRPRVLPPGPVSYAPQGDCAAVPEARRARALERARRVVQGEFEAFGHEWRPFPSASEDWHTHFDTRYVFARGPWWTIPHLPTRTDIKDVWEPARFGWAYDLLRGYALTGDRVFAETFRDRFRAWMDANPPYLGVHWSCGQEVAIRALAVLHAESGLPPSPSGAVAAMNSLASFYAWSAERIADAIGFAASQRNNHGISEAAGLIHLAIRTREADPRAGRWLTLGCRMLEECIADQFAVDGWYAQHSFNYMRVALEQALLAQRALQVVGRSLSARALARLDASLALLAALVEASTGVVPNHGANDGARVLPLSTAEHRDFRPVLTLGAVVRGGSLPDDVPPDPEVLCWLGAALGSRAPARGDVVLSGRSGWALARVGEVSVFLRAGRYGHRPSHIDPLHIDVRAGSCEVIVDPGTFSYNGSPPWKNGLTAADVHNGPTLDGVETARRGPRFLWYSWPEAELDRAERTQFGAVLTARVPGRFIREVEVTAARVEVCDRLLNPDGRTMTVSWLLHPSLATLEIVDVPGAARIEAREGDVRGWFSPTYGLRVPSVTIRARAAGDRARDGLRSIITWPNASPDPGR